MFHQILQEVQNPNAFLCQQQLNHLVWTVSLPLLPSWYLLLLATEEIFSAQVALVLLSFSAQVALVLLS